MRGRPHRTQSSGVPQWQLVDLAMDVPAYRQEADDWRVRGLAELLLQAVTTGDDALVDAVDATAPRIPDAAPRFVERLVRLRLRFGDVPAGYPTPRPGVPRDVPVPARVRAAAVRLAQFSDAHVPGVRVSAGARRAADAVAIASHLSRLDVQRPGSAVPYQCVDAPVPSELMWRGWFMHGGTPTVIAPGGRLSETAMAMMYGLHTGFHRDHLAALVEEGRPGAALRLQFGRGLLLAESAAMTAEMIALDGGRLPAEERAFLWEAMVDRLSRLPGIQAWGPRLLPGSTTMAAATGAHREFATLPRLSAAYVAGPFHLAGRGFDHPALPARIARFLAAGWPVGILG
jgi:hypothetical protein